VIRKRTEVNLKGKSLEKLNFKRQDFLQFKLTTEVKLNEIEQKRFELAKESEEETVSEKQFRASEANWQRKEKELKTKRKVLVGRAKNLVYKQKSLGGELGVLEEMKKQLCQSQSQDVLEDITLLEAEVCNHEKQMGVVEADYEQQHVDVTALTQDLNAKEAALSRQEGVVAKLQRELTAAGKINQGQGDSLACYPGARQVENEINGQSSRFGKLPVGPVGRFIRVDGDKNLLNLVEAELGSRLLRAYLVDNARDANVLSRILDNQYGASANKPMIITSRFLTSQHRVVKPELLAGSRCLLDLLQLQGNQEEQVVVYNCIVDQRGVEGVAVCESQQIAGSLCSGQAIQGLSNAVTLDWYRFLPATHHTAFRSYYISHWRSTYLTTPQGTDRLQGKKEEVSEAEAHRDSLGKEANEVRKR